MNNLSQNRTHLYLDENIERYSNVALGLISRSLGHNLSICYLNSRSNQLKLIEFFRNFEKIDFHFNDYMPDNLNYDLVIFDNFDLTILNKDEIKDLIKNKKSEFVFITPVRDDFDKIKDLFDLVSEYNYKDNDLEKENITIITGDGKGKSTYCFGTIIRNLLNNKKVKLIYFDKGGDIYGERFFFEKLNNNHLEISIFGTQRFDGKTFRFENTKQDEKEAQLALEDLQNSNNYDLIIADELNTTINSKLLEEKQIIDVIKNQKCNLIISGRGATQLILNISNQTIEVKEHKHYLKQGMLAKKGIDY